MKYTPEYCRASVTTSQEALEWAILRLYERQTADEQATDNTRHENGVGFNSADAKRLSKAATWIKSRGSRGVPLGQRLTGWHLEQAQKRVPKYARQISEICQERS